MVSKRLPTGAEIWAKVPKPALARNVLRQSRSGFYGIRLCKGKDIHKKPLFKVQVINIFGFMDDFCQDFTDDTDNLEDAVSLYQSAIKEAQKEYERLRAKQQQRFAGK